MNLQEPCLKVGEVVFSREDILNLGGQDAVSALKTSLLANPGVLEVHPDKPSGKPAEPADAS